MDAIIMCAGLGTRLRPLTDTTPKPLIPILGKGSLERTLDMLPSTVTRVILVVGYLADQIETRIGDSSHGRPVVYITQDPLDGTAGCLRQVRAKLSDLSETYLVMNGDDLYRTEDLAALVDACPSALVLETTLTKEEDSWVLGEGETILDLKRMPAGERGLINVGAYCLNQDWFATAPILVPGKTSEYGLPHALPELAHMGKPVRAIRATWWMPVGTHDELRAAETALQA